MTPIRALGLAALAFVSLSAAAHEPLRHPGWHAAAGTAAAYGRARMATPHIDARQAQQAHWIARGRASGRLTAAEASQLHALQRRVARTEARAKADGVVTRAERERLQALLDRSAWRIRREARDGQFARR